MKTPYLDLQIRKLEILPHEDTTAVENKKYLEFTEIKQTLSLLESNDLAAHLIKKGLDYLISNPNSDWNMTDILKAAQLSDALNPELECEYIIKDDIRHGEFSSYRQELADMDLEEKANQ